MTGQLNLEGALLGCDEFYVVPSKNMIISLLREQTCYYYKNYMETCEFSRDCELELGETLKSIHEDIEEISREKFIELWRNC